MVVNIYVHIYINYIHVLCIEFVSDVRFESSVEYEDIF